MGRAVRWFPLLFLCTIFIGGCVDKGEKVKETVPASKNGTCAIAGTDVTLQLEKAWDAQEVKPEDPGGYFYYYEDKEGYHYHVVYGKLLNPSQTTLCAEDFGAASWNGRKEYESKVLLENSTKSTFMESEDETVGEVVGLYIITMVKDGKEAPEKVELYYNSGLSKKEEDKLWEKGITIQPDSLSAS